MTDNEVFKDGKWVEAEPVKYNPNIIQRFVQWISEIIWEIVSAVKR